MAHARAHAERCAGLASTKETASQSLVFGIARAHTVLRDARATPTDRHRAAATVEQVLKKVANVSSEDHDTLDERWLRDTAYRLALALNPAGKEAGPYAAEVRTYLTHVSWPPGITRRQDLHTFLKAPPPAKWDTLGDVKTAPGKYAAGTIHSVKGKEFTSTIVILPKRPPTDADNLHAIDHWDQGTPSELRRVLYVGASRAQKLLILAVHATHTSRVEMLLNRDKVPYRRV